MVPIVPIVFGVNLRSLVLVFNRWNVWNSWNDWNHSQLAASKYKNPAHNQPGRQAVA
jgi:hypothetical protein